MYYKHQRVLKTRTVLLFLCLSEDFTADFIVFMQIKATETVQPGDSKLNEKISCSEALLVYFLHCKNLNSLIYTRNT